MILQLMRDYKIPFAFLLGGSCQVHYYTRMFYYDCALLTICSVMM